MKKFNFIELIVIIGILGLLIGIITFNAKDTSYNSKIEKIKIDLSSIQIAVDMFVLDKYGEYPTDKEPTVDVPYPLNFNDLYPEYLKSKLDENFKYWVDYNGIVWVSSIDLPTNIQFSEEDGTLTWLPTEGAVSYQIIKLNEGLEVQSTLRNTNLINVVKEINAVELGSNPEIHGLEKGKYLVNAIDKYDLETAPIGEGYRGYNEEPYLLPEDPVSEDPNNKNPIAVISMNPSENINKNSVFSWSSDKSYDTDGDTIIKEEWVNKKENYPIGSHAVYLRVQDSRGAWSKWTEKIFKIKQENTPPVAVISMIPNDVITTDTVIAWDFKNSYDPDGDKIVNAEWERKQDTYSIEGLYLVRLRVQDEYGLWSEWTEKEFYVIQSDVIKEIETGKNNSFIIKSDSSLWGFGSNKYGQLGTHIKLGDKINYPIRIMDNVKSVSAGNYHTVVLKKDGTIWTFGSNYFGQLGYKYGIYTNTPNYTPVNVFDNVKKVEAGDNHTLILDSNGNVFAFGLNKNGQLGVKDNIGYSTANPIHYYVMDNVRDISAKNDLSFFIKNNNDLWFSGNQEFEELVSDEENHLSNAILIAKDVKEVSSGIDFSLFLKTDNTLWGIGNNKHGQIGGNCKSGTNKYINDFVYIIDNVKTIETGNSHSLILKIDNTLWTIGSNKKGQIGRENNFEKNKENPNLVKILEEVNKISAAGEHSLVLKMNNELIGFGDNYSYQLGIDTNKGYDYRHIIINKKD